MHKITRIICLFILLAVTLAMPTANASAAITRCRTDPIFVLSNGDIISVTLDISTHAANIKNITYALHLPAGVTVKRVAYTAVNLRIPELYQVYQDSPARTHSVNTQVTTRNPDSVRVIVFGRLNGGIRRSVSGFNAQQLIMTLNRP